MFSELKWQNYNKPNKNHESKNSQSQICNLRKSKSTNFGLNFQRLPRRCSSMRSRLQFKLNKLIDWTLPSKDWWRKLMLLRLRSAIVIRNLNIKSRNVQGWKGKYKDCWRKLRKTMCLRSIAMLKSIRFLQKTRNWGLEWEKMIHWEGKTSRLEENWVKGINNLRIWIKWSQSKTVNWNKNNRLSTDAKKRKEIIKLLSHRFFWNFNPMKNKSSKFMMKIVIWYSHSINNSKKFSKWVLQRSPTLLQSHHQKDRKKLKKIKYLLANVTH